MRISHVQEEPDQKERIRKVRVEVDDIKRRNLIGMADARDLQEQMRKITQRLGSSILKIGEGNLDSDSEREKPE